MKYAALLRGIAPSLPNNSNASLRGVFERLGFDGVSSVLSSGNIIFASPETDAGALEWRIEQGLTADLQLSSRCLIRTATELRSLLDSNPFPGLSHGRGTYLTATFLKTAAQAPKDLPEQPDPLTRIVGYHPVSRAVLAVTDNSIPGSTPNFMGWLEQSCGKDITTRTWLTVQRLVKRLDAD